MKKGYPEALLAAALCALSTPLAKLLLDEVEPRTSTTATPTAEPLQGGEGPREPCLHLFQIV